MSNCIGPGCTHHDHKPNINVDKIAEAARRVHLEEAYGAKPWPRSKTKSLPLTKNQLRAKRRKGIKGY